ncbi:MAG: LysR family transcriptional regulator [Pseudomonadota bacterium]
MNDFNIKRLDLNLIKAFDALMRTRSVTKAAEDIGIGQPAMSHALSRLRYALNDELFIRMPEGMRPTRRAEESIIPIRRALAELEVAFRKEESFVPYHETFELTLGMSDYTETVILPLLLQGITPLAPNLLLKVKRYQLKTAEKQLEDNQLDLVFGHIHSMGPKCKRELVFHDYRRCVYSKHLVQEKTPITLKEYLSHRHVIRDMAAGTSSAVDRGLAKLGKKRNIVLATPRFSNLPLILTSAPLISTLPARLANLYPTLDELVVSNLPFKTQGIEVCMMWHIISDKDPAICWLRDRIRHVASEHFQPQEKTRKT